MDTARRWQLVTAVTAATGLGLGAMAVGHQPTQAVDAIELTPSPAATSAPSVVGGDDADGSDAEIVRPRVRSFDGSLTSPDDEAATSSPEGGDGSGSSSRGADGSSGSGSGASSGAGSGSGGTSGTSSGSAGTASTGGTASVDSPDDDGDPESADDPESVESAESADD